MNRPGSRKIPVAVGAVVIAAALASSMANAHGSISSTGHHRGRTVSTTVRSTPTPLDDAATQSPAPPTYTQGRTLLVPILMYHYIRVNPVPTDKVGFGLSVPPPVFATQMAYLHAMNVHTVTLAQVVSALNGATSLPPRAVVLTFDDGHDDFATQAVPILRQYGFVATDFVVSGFLGRTSYMTAAQVHEVDAEGMVIGAHTVNHVALAKMPLDAARVQILASKQMMEQLLGHPVSDFAYPYGSYNSAVAALVAQAGFRDAVTTVSGARQYQNDPFTMQRRKVGGGESLATFAAQADLPPPPRGWTVPTISSATPQATSPPGPPSATSQPTSPTPSPVPTSMLLPLLGAKRRRYIQYSARCWSS